MVLLLCSDVKNALSFESFLRGRGVEEVSAINDHEAVSHLRRSRHMELIIHIGTYDEYTRNFPHLKAQKPGITPVVCMSDVNVVYK